MLHVMKWQSYWKKYATAATWIFYYRTLTYEKLQDDFPLLSTYECIMQTAFVWVRACVP
jgi:hypothetical protein